jgi:hypothetical protein
LNRFFEPQKVVFRKSTFKSNQAFLSQPIRIFVNGMTVTGSNVTFYVFERSAVRAQEPNRLIQALIGYQLMTDKEMGFDQTMEIEGEFWIIQFAGKTFKSHGPHRRPSGISSIEVQGSGP